jgi:hypothetical protein
MFAAAGEDGELEFDYSDSGFCNGGLHQQVSRWRHGHFSKLRVEGRNLLRYLQAHAPADIARVRYIKIDTEGADREVVRSLAPLIAKARPYIRTEFYRHLPADERAGFLQDLRDLGYRVFKYEEDGHAGEPLDPEKVQRWAHFDAFAIPHQLK